MSTLVEKFGDLFISKILLGMYILPTDPNTLGAHRPKLDGLPRDPEGILMQLQDAEPRLDGGDSAHKSGIAAFCNSAQDQALLPRFELFPDMPGIMVRHPTQGPAWTNWKNCTRDQLLAYAAGCWRAGRQDIVSRLVTECGKRGWTCQNTEDNVPGTKINPVGDILGPHDQMFLRTCAGEDTRFDFLGHLTLQVIIEASDPAPDVEKNQIMMQSIVCGRLDLYIKTHPNYRLDITTYWGGWRAQKEIGEALIEVVEIELKRYKGQVEPYLILPMATINELRNLIKANKLGDLFSLDPATKLELLDKFAKAMLSDLQVQAGQMLRKTIEEIQMAAEAAGAALQAGVDLLAKALEESERIVAEALKAAEAGAKLIDPRFIGAVISSVLLGIDISRRDGTSLVWQNEVSAKLHLLIQNTEVIIKDLSRLRLDIKEIVGKEFREHYIRSLHAYVDEIGVKSADANLTGLSVQQKAETSTLVNDLSILLYESLGYGFQVIPHALVAFSAILAAQTMIGTSPAEISKFKQTAIRTVFSPAIEVRDGESLNFDGQARASDKKIQEYKSKLDFFLQAKTVMIFARPDPNRPGFPLDNTLMTIGQGFLLNQVTVNFFGAQDSPTSIGASDLVTTETDIDFEKLKIEDLVPPAITPVLPTNFTDARQITGTRLAELRGWSQQLIEERPINAELKSFIEQLQKIIDMEKATIQQEKVAA